MCEGVYIYECVSESVWGYVSEREGEWVKVGGGESANVGIVVDTKINIWVKDRNIRGILFGFYYVDLLFLQLWCVHT